MELRSVIQGDGVVTNLEFHSGGQYLVMTTNESAIQLIDCFSGTEKKKVYAKNSGVSRIQFTHHESCVLIGADARGSFEVKYLCLYDNRYLRHFHSHTSDITSLSMSPISDNFISASKDKTVCIWDMNTPAPVAKLQLPSSFDSPLCSYDNSGVVFGVLGQDHKHSQSSLKLFDARAYGHGPFDNIFPKREVISSALEASNPQLTPAQKSKYLQSTWTSFEFSADGGRSILLNSNSEAIFLLDGFQSTSSPKVILGRKNESGSMISATFSADAKYVITGNDDNDLLIFDRESTELISSLQGLFLFFVALYNMTIIIYI